MMPVGARRVLVEVGELRSSSVSPVSANASGEAPLCDGRSVISAFSGKVDYILAGGKTESLASTVVDARRQPLRILREGAIKV